jgi:adenylate kinase family enzyme
VVAGSAGAGKSTVAQHIGRALGLPFVELDSYLEGPGWTVLPDFVERTAELAGSERWVTDSLMYPEVERLLLDRADTVVWLDLPKPVVMRRVARRTLRRGLPPRPVLTNGNKERLWAVLLPSSPLRTAWREHEAHREHLEGVLPSPGRTVIRIRSVDEQRAFQQDLTPPST